MPKIPGLIYQVNKTLESKMRFGESKHAAKQLKDIQGRTHSHKGIYSYNTHKTYLAKSCAFVKWAKEHYGCRTLEQARPYVDVYLQHYIDNGYSPSTQSTISNSLAKLYGCSSKDFIKTQPRRRADITRSRQGKAKARFSEDRNREFVDFCKATRLRRHEIENLRAENIRYDGSTGQYMITNLRGKGGRIRECPILSVASGAPKVPEVSGMTGVPETTNATNATKASQTSETSEIHEVSESSKVCETSEMPKISEVPEIPKVAKHILNTQPGQKVWPKVPTNADIHSYRADYCAVIYERYARAVEEIPKRERYYCRKDLKGVVYDKWAMVVVSRVLGHNRIGVVAGNYLYSITAKGGL